MRRCILLSIAVVLTLSTYDLRPSAQMAAPAAPRAFAADRLARLDTVLQRYVDENRVGGVVGLVLQDGRPV